MATLGGLAAGLVIALSLAFAFGSGSSSPEVLPWPSEESTPGPRIGRTALPAEFGRAPVELAFQIPPGVRALANSSLLWLIWPAPEHLGPDAYGPVVEVWWRVASVTRATCSREGGGLWHDPRPSEAYEVIRTSPILEVAEQRPFRFAGATGQAVDVSVRQDAQESCASDDRSSLMVADTLGKGIEAGHIVVPIEGVLRLATVEVAGHELLVAVTGSSVAELDRADAFLDTVRAEVVSR